MALNGCAYWSNLSPFVKCSLCPDVNDAGSILPTSMVHQSMMKDSMISTGSKRPQPPSRDGTLGSSFLILISSILGSSVLAVPWAVSQCGWGLGLGVLIGCALLTQLGASVLLHCADRVNERQSVMNAGALNMSLNKIASIVTPRLSLLPEVSPPIIAALTNHYQQA